MVWRVRHTPNIYSLFFNYSEGIRIKKYLSRFCTSQRTLLFVFESLNFLCVVPANVSIHLSANDFILNYFSGRQSVCQTLVTNDVVSVRRIQYFDILLSFCVGRPSFVFNAKFHMNSPKGFYEIHLCELHWKRFHLDSYMGPRKI